MIAFSGAFTLNCEYQYINWTMVGRRYTCNVLSIDFSDDNLIRAWNATGEHFSEELSDDDVEGVWIDNENFNGVFPQGIGEIFPSIVTIRVAEAGIRELTRNDLLQFPNLLMIVLIDNELETLDADVFDGTPNMECINFNRNRIRHLGPRVFQRLNNLMALRLADNFCIDDEAEMNPAALVDLLWNSSLKCPSTINQIENEILSSDNFRGVIDALIARIAELEGRVALLEGDDGSGNGNDTTVTGGPPSTTLASN